MYKLKFRKICSAAGYDTQGLRPKECIFSTYKHPSSRSRKRFSAKTEYQHFTSYVGIWLTILAEKLQIRIS
jgi:hypothetical protein